MSSTARPEHPPSTRLSDLAAHLGTRIDDTETAITGITLDSRQVRPGDVYAALPGAHAHGADFAAQAATAGAHAVLTDPTGADRARASGLPVLVVDRPSWSRANLHSFEALLDPVLRHVAETKGAKMSAGASLLGGTERRRGVSAAPQDIRAFPVFRGFYLCPACISWSSDAPVSLAAQLHRRCRAQVRVDDRRRQAGDR